MATALTQADLSVPFVPTLAFDPTQKGWEYIKATPPWLGGSMDGPGQVYFSDKRLFIAYPYLAVRPDVLLDAKIGEDWRTTKRSILRDRQAALPEGAYLACLLFEGKCEFEYAEPVNGRHAPLWYRTWNGKRDAYIAWLNQGGAPFQAALHNRHDEKARQIVMRVYSAQIGRGAIYAREPRLDAEGKVNAIHETLVSIRFRIVEAGTGDVLNVQMARRTARVAPEDSPSTIADGIDDVKDRRAAERAIDGFRRSCTPYREDFERRRAVLANQIAGLKRDRERPRAERFETIVARTTWEESLRHVKEPWQLAAVVEEHCDERFDAMQDVTARDTLLRDPEFSRLRRMIGRFECADERRQKLLQMAADIGFLPTP